MFKAKKLFTLAVSTLVVGSMAATFASKSMANPVFSYWTSGLTPNNYLYAIFNPVSTFEVNTVVLNAGGATAIVAPAGWTGTLAGGIATWTTTPGTVILSPGQVYTGFELFGPAIPTIQSYTISGQQFTNQGLTIVPVPEPGSLVAMAAMGAGFLGLSVRRGRKS